MVDLVVAAAASSSSSGSIDTQQLLAKPSAVVVPPPPPPHLAAAATSDTSSSIEQQMLFGVGSSSSTSMEYDDATSFLSQSLSSLSSSENLSSTGGGRMLDAQRFEVTDVLPPPNHDDVQVLVMAVAYMFLFLLGICGNVAVLTTIYHVIRSRKARLDNTLIYVIVLSCVDFGVCLSLPFTVIDQILGFWMFDSVLCKVHIVLENFGKILSALIITAMSFDRFAGVCYPQNSRLRSSRFAIYILIGLSAYALVTLSPLLWNFDIQEYILFEKITGNRTHPVITRMRIEKCTMINVSPAAFTTFTLFLCVSCYLIPLFLVAFFHARLLQTLRAHAKQFKSTQIPLMRISLYTLAVACFYFLCWTPFWAATAFAVYLEIFSTDQTGMAPPAFVYSMYFIHALPFCGSAVNWILYGALNSQLQQRNISARANTTTVSTTRFFAAADTTTLSGAAAAASAATAAVTTTGVGGGCSIRLATTTTNSHHHLTTTTANGGSGGKWLIFRHAASMANGLCAVTSAIGGGGTDARRRNCSGGNARSCNWRRLSHRDADAPARDSMLTSTAQPTSSSSETPMCAPKNGSAPTAASLATAMKTSWHQARVRPGGVGAAHRRHRRMSEFPCTMLNAPPLAHLHHHAPHHQHPPYLFGASFTSSSSSSMTTMSLCRQWRNNASGEIGSGNVTQRSSRRSGSLAHALHFFEEEPRRAVTKDDDQTTTLLRSNENGAATLHAAASASSSSTITPLFCLAEEEDGGGNIIAKPFDHQRHTPSPVDATATKAVTNATTAGKDTNAICRVCVSDTAKCDDDEALNGTNNVGGDEQKQQELPLSPISNAMSNSAASSGAAAHLSPAPTRSDCVKHSEQFEQRAFDDDAVVRHVPNAIHVSVDFHGERATTNQPTLPSRNNASSSPAASCCRREDECRRTSAAAEHKLLALSAAEAEECLMGLLLASDDERTTFL